MLSGISQNENKPLRHILLCLENARLNLPFAAEIRLNLRSKFKLKRRKFPSLQVTRTVKTQSKGKSVKNNQSECNKDQTNRSTFIKPIVKNPVIRTINRTLRISDVSTIPQFHKELIVNHIKRFQVSESFIPFDRRVTTISWHPKYPKIFVAGSKGGDLILHNLNGGDDYFNQGVGAGGSILGLKHSYEDPYTIYTASLTGRVTCFNFQESRGKDLLTLPFSLSNWFTSIDVCKTSRCILTGDCKGNAYLLGPSGQRIWHQVHLHTSKVTHVEFNVHDSNIFVTASNDHFMKLWDLRSFSSSKSKHMEPLATFPHKKAINSAYFSPSNGMNILTTDQHSELHIYCGPLWNKVITIIHPHRQFQHMTQMKAVWHPLEDIVIVGRYPDDNIKKEDCRTVDFYDGSSGQLLHQILSPTKNIVSLCAMNATGEVLATAAGCGITLLKDELLLKEDRSDPKSDDDIEKSQTNSNKNKKRKYDTRITKNVSTNKKVSSRNAKK